MMLIINARVGWNMDEVARLVAAFRLIIFLPFSQFWFLATILSIAGPLMEDRVLPWLAGRERRTPWTTRSTSPSTSSIPSLSPTFPPSTPSYCH